MDAQSKAIGSSVKQAAQPRGKVIRVPPAKMVEP
jgi:hypothetical protein